MVTQPCVPAFFQRQVIFYDFLFASLCEHFQKGSALEERICSYRSKFFPQELTPFKKGGKSEN